MCIRDRLTPSLAVVTSIDAEHLDIYGTKEGMQTAYHDFVKKIVRGGKLIYKKEINMPTIGINNIEKFTYSILTEKADFCIRNLRQDNGLYTYDFMTPSGVIEDLKLGLPGIMNVENSVAAMSAAYLLGVDTAIIRKALDSFQGAKRRFDYQIHSEKMVYIDDYAHHPEELKACITSARNIFKNKKITGIFQPHLFTRTRDFAPEFAESLSLLDEVYLLDIYPAREKPIKGVTSEIIFDKIRTKEKKMCSMDELLADIEKNDFEVLITMGAGNIDKLTLPIKEILMEKLNA